MQMRNTADDEAARTTEFLRESAAPAFRQAGVKVAGAFRTTIGPGSPSFLLISEYADLAAFEAVSEKVWSDAAFRKAYVSYTAGAPRVYERGGNFAVEVLRRDAGGDGARAARRRRESHFRIAAV